MLFANLDDIHVLCDPDRVAEIFLQVWHALHHAAGIQVNLGKTKVWNGAAIKPKDLHIFELRLRKAKDLRRREVLWCWACQLGTALSSRSGLPTRRDPIYSC